MTLVFAVLERERAWYGIWATEIYKKILLVFVKELCGDGKSFSRRKHVSVHGERGGRRALISWYSAKMRDTFVYCKYPCYFHPTFEMWQRTAIHDHKDTVKAGCATRCHIERTRWRVRGFPSPSGGSCEPWSYLTLQPRPCTCWPETRSYHSSLQYKRTTMI